MLPGLEYRTCLPGGASTRFLPKEHFNIVMDYPPLKAIGNRLGTGGSLSLTTRPVWWSGPEFD